MAMGQIPHSIERIFCYLSNSQYISSVLLQYRSYQCNVLCQNHISILQRSFIKNKLSNGNSVNIGTALTCDKRFTKATSLLCEVIIFQTDPCLLSSIYEKQLHSPDHYKAGSRVVKTAHSF